MSKKVLLTGDSKGLGQNIRNLLEINNFKVVGTRTILWFRK